MQKISMKPKYIKFIFLITVFLCASCSKQAMPPEKDIESFLKQSSSNRHATLENFEIFASQNIGDNVEPVIKLRTRSIWVFTEDLYLKYIPYEPPYNDIYKSKKVQGIKAEIYDIIISTLKGSSWSFRKTTETINAIDAREWTKGQVEELFTYQSLITELLTKAEISDSAVIHESDEYNRLVKERRELEKQKIEREGYKSDKMEYAMMYGENYYATYCSGCHKSNGRGSSIGPALAGSKIVAGSIDNLIKLITNGKPHRERSDSMFFNDEAIATVITYIRNSWGNQMGDVAKQSDVRKLR